MRKKKEKKRKGKERREEKRKRRDRKKVKNGEGERRGVCRTGEREEGQVDVHNVNWVNVNVSWSDQS